MKSAKDETANSEATKRRLIRVTFEYETDDGNRIVSTLDGEQVAEWERQIQHVCLLAHIHDSNPDWGKFNWAEEVYAGGSDSKPITTDGSQNNAL